MNRKKVHGVGINDADYVVRTLINGVRGMCPFYSIWSHMLERCYSKNKYRTYEGVSVCDEWLVFSNFRKWMIEQPWEGMQLDKDILVKGNKLYSQETCVFVPSRINSLLLDSRATRGEYPIGVCYHKKSTEIVSSREKPFKVRVRDYVVKDLGYFYTKEDAHKVWQIAKAGIIERAVEWWSTEDTVKYSFDKRVAGALLERSVQLRSDAENNIETINL